MEKSRQDSLLDMLVSLGAVCHYPTTENWIIVNPNWLANGIYRIITDKHHGCDNGFSRTPYSHNSADELVYDTFVFDPYYSDEMNQACQFSYYY